jgi:hypothetical protein
MPLGSFNIVMGTSERLLPDVFKAVCTSAGSTSTACEKRVVLRRLGDVREGAAEVSKGC